MELQDDLQPVPAALVPEGTKELTAVQSAHEQEQVILIGRYSLQ